MTFDGISEPFKRTSADVSATVIVETQTRRGLLESRSTSGRLRSCIEDSYFRTIAPIRFGDDSKRHR
jgi:hypothetical protein